MRLNDIAFNVRRMRGWAICLLWPEALDSRGSRDARRRIVASLQTAGCTGLAKEMQEQGF